MKKILFIATGGTVACVNGAHGLTPQLSGKELLKGVPCLDEICDVSVRMPFCLDSTNMTPKNWIEISKMIQESYDDFDGFVVTHGTDTLGYAAAALSMLIQNSEKPVTVTGSMLPMTAENSDAPRNIYNAFRCASHDGAWGVRVVFGGKIIDGDCAVKTHTVSADAFESVNRALSGTVGGEIRITHPPYSGEHRFYDRLDPRCAVVKLLPGCPPSVFDVSGDIRAVIIEGFGTGGLPEYGGGILWRKAASLIERGVYVIMSTQSLYGGTDLSKYEVGRGLAEKYGLLETGLMTTQTAAIKAMWALAYSNGAEEFGRLFRQKII